jgi:hypothetical protein
MKLRTSVGRAISALVLLCGAGSRCAALPQAVSSRPSESGSQSSGATIAVASLASPGNVVRSTSLMDIWSVAGRDFLSLSYFWRSANEVVVVYVDARFSVHVDVINVNTLRRLPISLAGPNLIGPQFGDEHGDMFFSPSFALSPNGMWLLGLRTSDQNSEVSVLPAGSTYDAIGIGNRERSTWAADRGTHRSRWLHWMRDSKSWFYVRAGSTVSEPALVLYRVDQRLPIAIPLRTDADAPAAMVRDGFVIGVSDNGVIYWIEPAESEAAESVGDALYSLDVAADKRSATVHLAQHVRMPPDMYLWQSFGGRLSPPSANMSPDGKRLAAVLRDNLPGCPTSSLCELDVAQGVWRVLLRYGPWTDGLAPVWSPDGRNVLVVVNNLLIDVPIGAGP